VLTTSTGRPAIVRSKACHHLWIGTVIAGSSAGPASQKTKRSKLPVRGCRVSLYVFPEGARRIRPAYWNWDVSSHLMQDHAARLRRFVWFLDAKLRLIKIMIRSTAPANTAWRIAAQQS
jgi:hypothetical protein